MFTQKYFDTSEGRKRRIKAAYLDMKLGSRATFFRKIIGSVRMDHNEFYFFSTNL
jgi:hypothetical protein